MRRAPKIDVEELQRPTYTGACIIVTYARHAGRTAAMRELIADAERLGLVVRVVDRLTRAPLAPRQHDDATRTT